MLPRSSSMALRQSFMTSSQDSSLRRVMARLVKILGLVESFWMLDGFGVSAGLRTCDGGARPTLGNRGIRLACSRHLGSV